MAALSVNLSSDLMSQSDIQVLHLLVSSVRLLFKYWAFILAGDAELKVKPEETKKLFEKCGAGTKHLHFFKDAFHENFMDRFEKEWTEKMQAWLDFTNE